MNATIEEEINQLYGGTSKIWLILIGTFAIVLFVGLIVKNGVPDEF